MEDKELLSVTSVESGEAMIKDVINWGRLHSKERKDRAISLLHDYVNLTEMVNYHFENDYRLAIGAFERDLLLLIDTCHLSVESVTDSVRVDKWDKYLTVSERLTQMLIDLSALYDLIMNGYADDIDYYLGTLLKDNHELASQLELTASECLESAFYGQ